VNNVAVAAPKGQATAKQVRRFNTSNRLGILIELWRRSQESEDRSQNRDGVGGGCDNWSA